jgi:hypothetical protein
MISYDPTGYASYAMKDNKFYKDFISSMGISSNAALFAPFNVEFSLIQGASGQGYLDFSNANLGGGSIGSFTGYRYVYHGNLSLSIYCDSNVAGLPDIAVSFLEVPNGNAGFLSYLFDMRRNAAADTVVNQSNLYQFESIGLKGLSLSVQGAGNASYTMGGVFTGVKISY